MSLWEFRCQFIKDSQHQIQLKRAPINLKAKMALNVLLCILEFRDIENWCFEMMWKMVGGHDKWNEIILLLFKRCTQMNEKMRVASGSIWRNRGSHRSPESVHGPSLNVSDRRTSIATVLVSVLSLCLSITEHFITVAAEKQLFLGNRIWWHIQLLKNKYKMIPKIY